MTDIEDIRTVKSAPRRRRLRKYFLLATLAVTITLCALWPTVLGPRVLFHAIGSENRVLAEIALRLFVSPDVVEWDGYSALAAASFCHPDFVRLLLDRGANPRAGGRFAPLATIAARHLCPSGGEIVEMLVSAGAQVETCVGGVSILETVHQSEVAEALLKHGADPNRICPPYGDLPLFSATMRPKILTLLLDHGAKITADERTKATPLHSAAHLGAKDYQTQVPQRLESAEILLAHGADVNAVDQDGMTPMDCAYEKSDKEMIALLAKHGGKAKKYANAKPSEDAQDPESEYHELYDVAEGVRKGPACSLSVRGDNKAIMEEGDNWSIIRGTVGVVSVNCRAPGYFHYAVLGMGAPVPKKLNMPLSGGMPSSARIKFDKVWNNGEMRWYYSRERVTDLVRALNRGDATHFAMRLVNVGDE